MAGSSLNRETGNSLNTATSPEILAPAGDLFKLKTAIAYGADAVYLAGDRFGLRQASDNFLPTELEEGCHFAHSRGKKVFVTLNAFLFDHELNELPPFLAQLEERGVDAVIVSDLGVLEQVKKFSNLKLHISTQASTLNVLAAKFWKAQGAERVVLGREVSIEGANHIREYAGLEVEIFIHGAMCMAYSGNCTISNYTAGRDSNRGGCVQSCRFQYELTAPGVKSGGGLNTSFLSSKDLRSIDLMPRILASRIDSLKIEGRNKGPLYLATAVRNYTRAKSYYQKIRDIPLAEFNKDLEKLSYRGYTQASLVGNAGPDSVYRLEDAEASDYQMLGYIVEKRAGDYVAVYLRGNLEMDDRVEVLGTAGDDLFIRGSEMRDVNARRQVKGKPNSVVFFPDQEFMEEGMILRKRVLSGSSGTFPC